MERNGWDGGNQYLPTPSVNEILGLDKNSLRDLVKRGVLRPPRTPNGFLYWGPRDIFSAFLAAQLLQEFKGQYGRTSSQVMMAQVSSNLTKAMCGTRKDQALSSNEWRSVVWGAKAFGVDFAGSGFDYTSQREF